MTATILAARTTSAKAKTLIVAGCILRLQKAKENEEGVLRSNRLHLSWPWSSLHYRADFPQEKVTDSEIGPGGTARWPKKVICRHGGSGPFL